MLCTGFVANFLENTTVKEFWKSANICLIYERMHSGTAFLTHRVHFNITSIMSNYWQPACMSVSLSDNKFQKPWCSKFIYAHLVHLQVIRVIVYKGRWVKVTATRAKNVRCYPVTPALQSEHDYNCPESVTIGELPKWCVKIRPDSWLVCGPFHCHREWRHDARLSAFFYWTRCLENNAPFDNIPL